jgi:cytochrome c-type biogenesis protein CcmE
MNQKQKKRLIGILSIFVILSIACGLILFALKQNINLFYTPSQLLHATTHAQQVLRVGGYVKNHSVSYAASGESVNFTITDRTHEIIVNYHGVLPNLFREGQAVVVTGRLNKQKEMIASQVLAKHDEKYVPSQLAKELKKENSHAS